MYLGICGCAALFARPEQEAQAWADLLFSMEELPMQRIWPGQDGAIRCLGLNLVRYNIGGVGRSHSRALTNEPISRLRRSCGSFVRALSDKNDGTNNRRTLCVV